jgi:hypothetical protein
VTTVIPTRSPPCHNSCFNANSIHQGLAAKNLRLIDAPRSKRIQKHDRALSNMQKAVAPAPVVAAGWLAATAVGAAAGCGYGWHHRRTNRGWVSEEDAHSYAEGVRRGGTLVTARVPDADRARFESILDQSSEIFATERPCGKNPDGSNLIPNASPTASRKCAENDNCLAVFKHKRPANKPAAFC